jgi:hypothetical protein
MDYQRKRIFLFKFVAFALISNVLQFSICTPLKAKNVQMLTWALPLQVAVIRYSLLSK